ncbi:MAG: hypothetical protein JW776_07455 [Candidatus Lokiarchaeota archaeon]|nr:hypothetical protein [Candidatus Lokiarchaeota archaeon]
MKEKLTVEDLRLKTDNVIKAVFRAIDNAPNVAIIGEQSITEPNKWSLLGTDRNKYEKHVKECIKLITIKEDSYIPSKKDKISLKKWDKLVDKVTHLIK